MNSIYAEMNEALLLTLYNDMMKNGTVSPKPIPYGTVVSVKSVCTCGAAKIGCNSHSDWCDIK